MLKTLSGPKTQRHSGGIFTHINSVSFKGCFSQSNFQDYHHASIYLVSHSTYIHVSIIYPQTHSPYRDMPSTVASRKGLSAGKDKKSSTCDGESRFSTIRKKTMDPKKVGPCRINVVEGSLNSKLLTIWRVEKQMKSRWDEVKSEESKVRRWSRVRRKKMQ